MDAKQARQITEESTIKNIDLELSDLFDSIEISAKSGTEYIYWENELYYCQKLRLENLGYKCEEKVDGLNPDSYKISW